MIEENSSPTSKDSKAEIPVGAWLVRCEWPPGHRGGPTKVTIEPHPDGNPEEIARGITTGTLRKIPLAQTIDFVNRAMDVSAQAYASGRTVERAIEMIKSMVEANPRPGSRGRPDLFYALVATTYVHRLLTAESPVNWLAKETDTDRRTAENWLRLARKHGMLTDPIPGVAGGELTDKATTLLAAFNETEEN
jgi:hypothetical protein